ncbi:uncharacterized protein LOC120123067 [Hibiscus syriacus]|uniref:uncharacterized protein LOC120123067 n=1 Tax=Hibiscus syriacus TaxID=106335 RepID=UPI001921FE19|nr:uncharacterized protein LOC120123067 [Hibiscus syriacus]
METEVRFNMLLPGYYSLTNLKCNSGNVGWPLPCENMNSGPYSDFLLRLAMGYDKEQIRKTILEHDSVFRHQLHELHRLYGIQRDLMNEIKSKGGEKYLIPQATSHSNPFSCGSKTEDKRKRWQTSESHCSELNCFRLFTSDANGIHSQFSSFKGNAPKSSCCLTKNGLKSKNCESLESQPNKVRTRLFELESPAGEYINNEGGARGVSAKGSYEVSGERNGNLSMLYDSNYSSNGEATSFDLKLKRTRGFTDLNEPIPVEESSSSACVGIPTNVSCSKKEVQRKDLLSMSQLLLAFNQRGVEVFPEPGKARERWISLINPDLEVGSRQNGGGFSNKFENGQPRSNGSFHPEDLQAPHKSVQVETTEARPAMFLSFNENKRGMFGKRKIFGIEIPENGNGVSTVTSHGLDQLSVHSWSDAAHSEILSVSSRAKFNGNSSHNRSWTYGQLNTSSDHPNANAGRIDLNLCVTEKGIEDIRSTSSVRTNVRIAEIDLEMPMNSEMGTKDTLDYKSLENNLTKPSNVLHGEVDETLGLTSASVAAEALIAISSSCVSYLHQNARSDKSEVSASDSLLWFAEIVTSCRSDTENDVG